MTWIRTVTREIFGLFVDDGNFALLILLWLAFAVFLVPYLWLAPKARGFVLFAGLAALLLVSTVRYARR